MKMDFSLSTIFIAFTFVSDVGAFWTLLAAFISSFFASTRNYVHRKTRKLSFEVHESEILVHKAIINDCREVDPLSVGNSSRRKPSTLSRFRELRLCLLMKWKRLLKALRADRQDQINYLLKTPAAFMFPKWAKSFVKLPPPPPPIKAKKWRKTF